jgi:hypothetical protein
LGQANLTQNDVLQVHPFTQLVLLKVLYGTRKAYL